MNDLHMSDLPCDSRVVTLYGDLGALKSQDNTPFMDPSLNQQVVGQDILPYPVCYSYGIAVLLISSFVR